MSKTHPVHVLDDEGSRADFAQSSIKVLVKVVDRILVIASSALAVALTRVASHKQFSLTKARDVGDVADLNDVLRSRDCLVEFASRFVGVIGPHRLDTGLMQAKIAATAP